MRATHTGIIIKMVPICLLAVLLMAPQVTQAYTFGFNQITSNTGQDISGQFKLDVLPDGLDGDRIKFIISNDEFGVSSEITEVYFADLGGFLGGTYAIYDSPYDVYFHWGATPSDLPSWGGYVWTASYDADSDLNGTKPDDPWNPGVNPGEEVGFSFYLANGVTAEQLIASMDETFNVGLHVREIPDLSASSDGDGSESFQVHATPEPSAFMLLGSSMLGLMGLRYRVRRRRKQRIGT
jgi:hypothetical protein